MMREERCIALTLFCRVHANGGLVLLCPSSWKHRDPSLSWTCIHWWPWNEMKGGHAEARKPCGQSGALSCMKAGLQNLISLTALTAGFKSVGCCESGPLREIWPILTFCRRKLEAERNRCPSCRKWESGRKTEGNFILTRMKRIQIRHMVRFRSTDNSKENPHSAVASL